MDIQQPKLVEDQQEEENIEKISVQIAAKNFTLSLEQNIFLSFNQQGIAFSKYFQKGSQQQSSALNIFVNYRSMTSVGKDGSKIMVFTGDGDQNQEIQDSEGNQQEQNQNQVESIDDKTLKQIEKVCCQVNIKNDINFNLNGNFSICIDLVNGVYYQKQESKKISKEKIQQIYDKISENLGDDQQQSQQDNFDMDQMISADDIDQNGMIIKKSQEKQMQDQQMQLE